MPPDLPAEALTAADPAIAAASATTRRFRESAEAGDIPAMLDTLAEDVVLRSPITDRVSFHGREEIGELLASVFAVVTDIHYFADVGDEHTRALFDHATVAGQPLEQAVRVTLDERHLITEITIFFRPLPGLATLTAQLAPRIARRHGRIRSLAARLLVGPLGASTRLGDRLTTWFT